MLGDEILQGVRRNRGVGENEAQHRRHVGRDHAGALAEAVDRDLGVADQRRARRELRIRVCRHDRPRRLLESVGFGAFGETAERCANFVASSGSPMTPVEATKTSCGLQPTASTACATVISTASRPFLPVKALALPELTTSARAAPFFRCLRQTSTGADAVFDCVEDSGDRRPFVQHGEQKIGTLLVANAGFGRRKRDALDCGQLSKRFRRERRNARSLAMGYLRFDEGAFSGEVGPGSSKKMRQTQ